ncbi:MAG: GH39 family glycosyl hydrolase [Terriglobia bacterium]
MRNSKTTAVCCAMVTAFLWARPGLSQTHAGQVEVDFSRSVGTIRHLNDLEGGTLSKRGWIELSPYFKELGVEHVRLHDVPWDFDDVQDINYVFPHFDADADEARNYDFAGTDWFLKPLKALGVEIIYRLGYSAEEDMLPRVHNAPPKDFEKWAHVCLNIVKHYNGGWDNGFHHRIKYWEIWNEPDGSQFWTGTPQEYYKLYETTARVIKNYDPSLKVGGPTLAYSVEFLEGFLKYCQEHRVPVDFVSWHRYSAEPYSVLEMSEKVRGMMTQYGFGKAESILDEWNYMPGDWGRLQKDARYGEGIGKQNKGIAGAAYDSAVLTYLQDSTVDIATFYTGTTIIFWGLFDEYGVPAKPFYSFKAFSDLLGTPQRVFTAGSDREGFTVIAGLSPDKSQATVLITNFAHGPRHYALALKNLPWSEKFTCETYLLDESRNLEMVKSEGLNGTTATLSVEDFTPPSVWLFRLKQGAGK